MARPMSLRASLPGLISLARRLYPQLHAQRVLIGGAMFALVAEVGFRLLEPWPLSFVIDYALTPPTETDPTWIVRLSGSQIAVACGVALVIVAALRAFTRYVSSVGFALIGNRITNDLRHTLYRHIQSLSIGFHSRARRGDMVVRVIGDIGLMREVVVTALLPLLGNLLILAGMLAVMLWMNWKIALVAFATLPAFALSTLKLGRRIQDVSRKQRRTEGHLANTAAEAMGAIETIQAYALDDAFLDTFDSQGQRSVTEGVKGKRLAARLERTADVLNALAQALVLVVGAHVVMRGQLLPGELLVLIAYQRSAFRPLRDLAKYSARLAKASAVAERVIEVLDTEPEVRDQPGAVEAPPFRGALQFERVHFAYSPGVSVLDGIDFSVPAGQRVAIVGPSGVGKSTLVGLCLRLLDPGSGTVRIDGRDVREFTLASLRSQLGVVLQDTVLFATTLRENIAFGAPDTSEDQIVAAVELAGATAWIDSLPQGLETPVGEQGVTLSRGQRQRVSIARAAVRKSPILLLDEPTTGLDAESERDVLAALDSLSRDRTTLWVTHDISQARACDRILVFDAGRIVEDGAHEELIDRAGLYAASFESQHRHRGDRLAAAR